MKKAKIIKLGKHYFKIGEIVTVVKESKHGIIAFGSFGNAIPVLIGEFEFINP